MTRDRLQYAHPKLHDTRVPLAESRCPGCGRCYAYRWVEVAGQHFCEGCAPTLKNLP